MHQSSTMIVCDRWKFESAATKFYDSETFEDLLKKCSSQEQTDNFWNLVIYMHVFICHRS